MNKTKNHKPKITFIEILVVFFIVVVAVATIKPVISYSISSEEKKQFQ